MSKKTKTVICIGESLVADFNKTVKGHFKLQICFELYDKKETALCTSEHKSTGQLWHYVGSVRR